MTTATAAMETEAEPGLADLDLDIQLEVTGGADATFRPEMFTFVTCETTGTSGTSCNLTNGCNPPCC
ncbi:hypothetical protein [Actinoalloteichus caeruleus]|uniref:FxLD family lantipeptide n=1 Tax=Actinoalloteichus caeruleus DSM 43889 TaxID=1120930 RepID=A0ABT1JES4_ACTCY|nr:hypothetical protein [Actinoalloteichus caeruleus]MCP2331000.1 hypothetical protein [Actinoalloteichus caeruleus DSM 43889]